MKMGQIARKALGLGTTRFPLGVEREIMSVCTLPPKLLSRLRLVEAMRKLDPVLASQIEKLVGRR